MTISTDTQATPLEPWQPMTEQVADWRSADVKVDFAERTVKNIVLSGGVSRNGHRYTDEALNEAVAKYDQKPVFLDHAANVARPFERSTRDLVGTITQPRFEQGRIRGDIQVLDTEAGRIFLALMEGRSPAVGMSHVVLAQRGSNPQVVEHIHDVVSVDAVVFPATTNGFHESDQTALPGSWEALIEQIDAALPMALRDATGLSPKRLRRVAVSDGVVLAEAVDSDGDVAQVYEFGWQSRGETVELQLTKSDVAPTAMVLRERRADLLGQLRSELAATIAERDALRDREQQRQQDTEIDALITESGVPLSAVTEAFRAQLRSLPQTEQRRQWLNERADFVRRCSPKPLVSHSRSAPHNAADAAFIRAIRGHQRGVLGS